MAVVRNLRNFDKAGISSLSVDYVQGMIESPQIVRESRMLPYRWYQAYRSVESVRWAGSLDTALGYSLGNIPTLRGRTLVLVDMSGSMFQSKVSPKSDITYADAACLFGAAWKLRNPEDTDLFQFGSELSPLESYYQDHSGTPYGSYRKIGKGWKGVTKKIELGRGGSILTAMGKFHDMGGTQLHQAVAETWGNGSLTKYDRVVILTDEQAFRSQYEKLPVPDKTPVYVWNFAGYRSGVMPRSGSHNRHTFGGLNDTAFQLIPLLERGKNTGWPWEVGNGAT
jgi:hypothetical protein